ncbi:YtxH domain-containing protein [Prosthecochloris sp. N3]|uniref:YtxH domain-containing protein n=1 Tax=Prosthecochloris ethylica TaxID=2743976 RepID=A0ABR9XNX8_9CHLB|nr:MULTISPECIES: YtxH domain-containing protein [Prosthecochloris]MBF0585758.1 YtxH domain-containing protein [Prosthecochloris ethylica]MBF0635668.1 YtxH domain-containing protein [Prosthecochloris ethylica]NUK46967.1 YtxH domain-containing protein [Prosthecochloris ethylica]RNA65457.1 YtxH domain-containing protein [Prosthecochloris sp. ZM_2]
MEHQDNYYKGLFYGALLGAAAGTVMGLLFAPQKGRETQQIISGKFRHALGRASDRASEFYDEAEEGNSLTNEALERSNEIIENAKDEARKILADANSILREIKTHAKGTTKPEEN